MKLEGVPKGYDAVRFGRPVIGELFVSERGDVCEAEIRFRNSTFLIVRKIEPVLDLSKVRLKKGWIAQDKDGANYWFPNRPTTTADMWVGDCGTYVTNKAVHICWCAVPWTERIMEIPE